MRNEEDFFDTEEEFYDEAEDIADEKDDFLDEEEDFSDEEEEPSGEERAPRKSSQKTAGRCPDKHRAGAGRRKKRRRKKGLNGHSIFFMVLAVIFVLTIIRLLVWNMGKRSEYDPNDISTEFDVEVLDYILSPDPALMEGHEAPPDDGVTTILALGNDIFSDDRGDSGLAELIAKETDSVVLNGAFPGSTIAMKNAEYDNSYPLDGLSLYWTAAALVNQNFDLMQAVVPDLDSEAASAALETLQGVDLNQVDHLILLYDMQDYIGKRIVYDENNLKNLNTVYGALSATIQLFQENYPHIRIFVLSHPYGSFTDGDGSVYDGDRDDLGNGTLVDYLNWELEACRSNGVSFIDNYYGAVTVEDTDCLENGFHLNQKGRERIAQRFGEILGGK